MTFSFVFFLGLVIGSFIGAYTYRAPRNIKISRGRSFCPKCKKAITWYDNIPLFSYLILKGRCRNCRREISVRYPLIELLTATLFVLVFLNIPRILNKVYWLSPIPHLFIVSYLLFVTSLLIIIFITDFEKEIILDEVILWGTLVTVFLLLLNSNSFYQNLFSGFMGALFLLLIHLVTRGAGMGLGDVKLAIFVGSFLGLYNTFFWITGAFVIGAMVSILLVIFKKKGFKDRVPFGPFLVASFFVTVFTNFLVIL